MAIKIDQKSKKRLKKILREEEYEKIDGAKKTLEVVKILKEIIILEEKEIKEIWYYIIKNFFYKMKEKTFLDKHEIILIKEIKQIESHFIKT